MGPVDKATQELKKFLEYLQAHKDLHKREWYAPKQQMTQTELTYYSAIFPSYRYCVKTRKQGRDAKIVYWKCTKIVSPGNINTADNLVTRLSRDQNHPPSHAYIKAKLFMSHLPEKAHSCLDPLPTLYDSEILQFRCREWDEDPKQIVEKIPTSTACKSSLYRQRNTELHRQTATRQNIDVQTEWRETLTGNNDQYDAGGKTQASQVKVP
ncbi:unnamed protein product [Mytilus edulis]|uniref:Uncharacterized protein n=1 Tax=Mytilus edulis TaxID=6550 RepID=A0A8S3SJ83_MYTED|nr:unnamed protein product [Mytilus edulis]